MSGKKNRGGRPKGSVQHDFRIELREVAKILIKDPKVRPRAAMIRVLKKSPRPSCGADDNGLRTLQRRWESQGQQILQEVRESLEERFYGDRGARSERKPQPTSILDMAMRMDETTAASAFRDAAASANISTASELAVLKEIAASAKINMASELAALRDIAESANIGMFDAASEVRRSLRTLNGVTDHAATDATSRLSVMLKQLEPTSLRAAREHWERQDHMQDMVDRMWRSR